MKIVYSLPHPADQLESSQAGHTVRARAILSALERRGHEIIRVQAAAGQQSQAAVSTYRSIVKKLLPRPIAMRLRDTARVAYSRRYAGRLIEALQQHRPDVILETHIAFTLAGKIASAETGIPLVLDDVAPPWEEEEQYGVGSRKLARQTYQEITHQARMLVAVSGAIRRLLIAEGLPEEKIVTVSNGIYTEAFDPNADGTPIRKRYNIPSEAVVIGFVGSFQPYHRVDLLLEAFARLRQTRQGTHLLLIGSGKRFTKAQNQAERLGLLSDVTFTGQLPYEDVGAHTAAADITIMPATNTYGNPMKIYEYMAMGKAVIAPDQETITEIVTHGENAYLFAPEDIDSMAAALSAVIDDDALRHKLQHAALASSADHTWDERAKVMEDALHRATRR